MALDKLKLPFTLSVYKLPDQDEYRQCNDKHPHTYDTTIRGVSVLMPAKRHGKMADIACHLKVAFI